MPRFPCPYCPKTFPNEAKRDRHIAEKQAAGKKSHREDSLMAQELGLTEAQREQLYRTLLSNIPRPKGGAP